MIAYRKTYYCFSIIVRTLKSLDGFFFGLLETIKRNRKTIIERSNDYIKY
jgi:hypothetical protein